MFSGSNKQFSKVFRYSVWPECMTRPRYCCLFSTTTKSSKQFFVFAKFALRECLARNTEVNTFVLGIQGQKISRNPKTRSKFKTPPPLGRVYGFWEVFLDSGKCFGFWKVFLDSGTCLWILGRGFGFWDVFFGFWDVFLDSGKCFWILGSVFGFWDVFLDYGKCFGFRDVFWILGRVLSLQATD